MVKRFLFVLLSTVVLASQLPDHSPNGDNKNTTGWPELIVGGEQGVNEPSIANAPPPETEPGQPEVSTNTLGGIGNASNSEAVGPASSEDTMLLEDVISTIEDDADHVLEVVLSEGLDSNSRYNDSSFEHGNVGDTLLHWAARFDSPKCAKVLIENGAELEARNSYEATPLHVCAWNGSTAAVEVLMHQGADGYAKDHLGKTPRHYAARYDHSDILKILLRHVDYSGYYEFYDYFDEEIDNEGFTPLHAACNGGSVESAEILLEYGADVDERSDSGLTPLHEACTYGQGRLVKVLLNEGANIDPIDDDYGESPLHKASQYGYPRIAKILVRAGASKMIRNIWGETPYDIVCIQDEADCSKDKKKLLKALLYP